MEKNEILYRSDIMSRPTRIYLPIRSVVTALPSTCAEQDFTGLARPDPDPDPVLIRTSYPSFLTYGKVQ